MSFIGSVAPNFRLQDEKTYWRELKDFLAEGPLLLAFYPGDFTRVCTKQLCAYQESFDAFKQIGVNVAGISGNSPASHQEFKAHYKFDFPLLSDPGKEVTKQYGVVSLFMLGGTSRAVFVVNRDGRIAYRYVEPTTLTHRSPAELIAKLVDLKRQKII